MAKRNWPVKSKGGEVTSRIDPSLVRTPEEQLALIRRQEVNRQVTGELLPKSMRDVKQDPKTYVAPKYVK
jgi:hypothetical protein